MCAFRRNPSETVVEDSTRKSGGHDTEPWLMPHPKAMRLLSVKPTKYRELRRSGVIECVDLGRSSMAKTASVKRAAGITD
jgi:hypothetical protein